MSNITKEKYLLTEDSGINDYACTGEGRFAGYDIVSNPPEMREVLESIFTDAYMQEYTSFTSFDAFRYSSAVIVNWEKDPMIYSKQLFDNFVNESTKFKSFDEMVLHALTHKT